MPTPDEIRVEIELVLRSRFFSMVLKVEKTGRENWSEQQHDNDRLSRALAAYTLVLKCGLDDVTAVAALTDGSDDKGIDSVYFDQLTKKLVIVQSKFKQAAPNESEAQKTINGVRALLAKRYIELNTSFQNRQQEIDNALKTPGVKVEIVFVYLGENFNKHAEKELEAYKKEINEQVKFLSLEWNATTGLQIHKWILEEQSPKPITDTVSLENWKGIDTPRKAYYGQISALEIVRLVKSHKHSLFNRNIRHYLGTVGVNPSIEGTIKNRPSELFYLNNGITITAEVINPSLAGSFELVNFSIVNGAQTAGSIASAAQDATILPEAKLLVTIIEIGTGDNIGNQITKARNSQNQVNNIDYAALTPVQERLRQELAAIGITYYYRPSAEAQEMHADAFKLENAALAIACLGFPIYPSIQSGQKKEYNGLELVISAKKEVGELWRPGGALTQRIFSKDLTGIQLCRIVRIYKFIDEILASSELSETSYYRRMFFRHGRYLIMAVVAKSLSQVIGRTSPNLSPEDKTLISQQVNKLAEQFYTISEPHQQTRGYLATFRNLTHTQPLVDNLLQQLEQEKAAFLTPTLPIPPTE